MQDNKYTLLLENRIDISMNSIMVGDLYLVDQQNNRTFLSNMVLDNYQFVDDHNKVLMPLLTNKSIDGVNNYCMQIAVADLTTETIIYYDKAFSNNGQSIDYNKGRVTVWNEKNEFAKTQSIDLEQTSIEKSKKFEIYGKHFLYFKRYWDENRGDQYSFWGRSWWYFETDSSGNIKRQIEEYDNQTVKCYDLINQEDEFGGLGKMPIQLEEFTEFAIYKEDFERVWEADFEKPKNDLYGLLKRMKLRPGMYLGEKTITALWHFVNGYNSACYLKEIEEELWPRWNIFNEFVKRKTDFSESTGGWKHMILSHCEGDEEKAVDIFFEYFDEFKTGNELSQFIKTLVPKNKHDMSLDRIMDFYWYNYNELKPIIPALLIWLQDRSWPVATPIARHLSQMLPDILPDLVAILKGDNSVWKSNILQIFFIDTKSEHYLKILDVVEQLAFRPTPDEQQAKVDLLAKQIIQSSC